MCCILILLIGAPVLAALFGLKSIEIDSWWGWTLIVICVIICFCVCVYTNKFCPALPCAQHLNCRKSGARKSIADKAFPVEPRETTPQSSTSSSLRKPTPDKEEEKVPVIELPRQPSLEMTEEPREQTPSIKVITDPDPSTTPNVRPKRHSLTKTATKTAESEALPAWWKAIVDPKTGKTYYQNNLKKITSWKPPTVEQTTQERKELESALLTKHFKLPKSAFNREGDRTAVLSTNFKRRHRRSHSERSLRNFAQGMGGVWEPRLSLRSEVRVDGGRESLPGTPQNGPEAPPPTFSEKTKPKHKRHRRFLSSPNVPNVAEVLQAQEPVEPPKARARSQRAPPPKPQPRTPKDQPSRKPPRLGLVRQRSAEFPGERRRRVEKRRMEKHTGNHHANPNTNPISARAEYDAEPPRQRQRSTPKTQPKTSEKGRGRSRGRLGTANRPRRQRSHSAPREGERPPHDNPNTPSTATRPRSSSNRSHRETSLHSRSSRPRSHSSRSLRSRGLVASEHYKRDRSGSNRSARSSREGRERRKKRTRPSSNPDFPAIRIKPSPGTDRALSRRKVRPSPGSRTPGSERLGKPSPGSELRPSPGTNSPGSIKIPEDSETGPGLFAIDPDVVIKEDEPEPSRSRSRSSARRRRNEYKKKRRKQKWGFNEDEEDSSEVFGEDEEESFAERSSQRSRSKRTNSTRRIPPEDDVDIEKSHNSIRILLDQALNDTRDKQQTLTRETMLEEWKKSQANPTAAGPTPLRDPDPRPTRGELIDPKPTTREQQPRSICL